MTNLNPSYITSAAVGKSLLESAERNTKFYSQYPKAIVDLHKVLYAVVTKAQDSALWPAFSLKKIKLFKGETLTDLLLANAIVLALQYTKQTPGYLVEDKAVEYYTELATKRISLASPFFNNLRKKEIRNLSSCFIMEVGDSLESIMKHVTYCARISKAGGGASVFLGKIRAKGAKVNGNKNAASSVLSWVRMYDQVCVSVNQLGQRPGAITVALPIWHADIEEFLDCQTENGDLRAKAFNIQPQVCIPDEFMQALELGQDYYLFCPKQLADKGIDPSKQDGWYSQAVEAKLYRTKVSARKLWALVQERQRTLGRPYIFFTNNVQVNSPFKKNYGNINSANLCCFSAETLIRTSAGDLPIANLAGTLEEPNRHEVWNGINYSTAPVYKVADNQALYRVHFTQGQYVDVTADHSFYIAPNKFEGVAGEPDYLPTLKKVETKDLIKGMRLPRVWVPASKALNSEGTKHCLDGYCQLANNYVSKVERLFGAHSVYCLTEPLRNMVIANGVPTGQCESYSYFEAERYIHCCNLISINLTEHESLESVAMSTAIATEMADLSLSLSTIDIPEAKAHVEDFRTIGLGCMGLADWLAKHGEYYSSLKFIEETQKTITKAAYKKSVELAEKWGSCLEYKSLDSELWDKLDLEPDLVGYSALRKMAGIRNSMLIATAPNTSTSLVMGSTASFLPPYQLEFYDESEDHTLNVVTKYLPDAYLTASQIPCDFITDATAALQTWTDAGLSMEYLLPKGASWATNKAFSDTKIKAWKAGVKAIYYLRELEQSSSTCDSCAN